MLWWRLFCQIKWAQKCLLVIRGRCTVMKTLSLGERELSLLVFLITLQVKIRFCHYDSSPPTSNTKNLNLLDFEQWKEGLIEILMNRGIMEAKYVWRHHSHQPKENQCSSSVVKHIEAPVDIVISLSLVTAENVW